MRGIKWGEFPAPEGILPKSLEQERGRLPCDQGKTRLFLQAISLQWQGTGWKDTIQLLGGCT